MHDKLSGVIVGDSGVILRTTDSGKNWLKLTAQFKENLFDVSFLDKQTGFIVGQNGVCLQTKNGGESWQKIDVPINKNLYKLQTLPNGSIIVISDYGRVIKSYDNGLNWKIVSDSIHPRLKCSSIDFLDDKTGIIVGSNGLVMRTKDGGDSWSYKLQDTSYFAVINTPSFYYAKYLTPSKILIFGSQRYDGSGANYGNYISEDSGATITGRKIFVSLDGGEISNGSFNKGVLLLVGTTIAKSEDLAQSYQQIAVGYSFWVNNDIVQFSDGRIFAASGFITQDTGTTWSKYGGISIQGSNYLFHSWHQDSAIGISRKTYSPGNQSGLRNRIGITHDGGISWKEVEGEFPLALDHVSKMSFGGRNNGIIKSDSTILFSEDGGMTWKISELKSKVSYISDIQMISSNTGFAVGYFNEQKSNKVVHYFFKTINGGKNWDIVTQITLNDSNTKLFNGIYFMNSQKGSIVGSNGVNAHVLSTTNGGISWDTVYVKEIKSLHAIKFFNKDSAYAVGSSAGIFKTDNGGNTWVREYPWEAVPEDSVITLNRIFLLADRKTFFVGGVYLGNGTSFGLFLRKQLINGISGVREDYKEFIHKFIMSLK